MLSFSRALHCSLRRSPRLSNIAKRHATTNAAKKVGDISSVFVSLSGKPAEPLPRRYAELKGRLLSGNEDAVWAGWVRLLKDLRKEIQTIAALGPNVIPEIDFKDLSVPSSTFVEEHKKRGVAVIRGVVPEAEAAKYKTDVEDYVRANPATRAFPPHDPQVFELYWSPSQVRARAHPNLLEAQRFLMSYWHSNDPAAPISMTHPTAYADRLRIRHPGDAGFALGPHVDGGSVERWEEQGYGLGSVYDKVFSGDWEEYDPWEASCRLPVVSDLYNGAGACSMFRMFQGWLSMSETGPGEGTLLVNPLLGRATTYFLLRPFFFPKNEDPSSPGFLGEDNWALEPEPSSALQGAFPSQCMELNSLWHPHLELDRSMVHVPKVKPGDYVSWHCDTIHAVDRVHAGVSHSSVLYIPACPLTEGNAEYLVRQREAFLKGLPGPDFPGGPGESNHSGRPDLEFLHEHGSGPKALRAMGLEKWDIEESGLADSQKAILRRANQILGF